MPSKTKRQALSLETKMAILRTVDAGRKKADVARDFQLASSTLSTILKNRERITWLFESSMFEPSRKKCRPAVHQDIDEAVIQWFWEMKAKNRPINGPLIREKAEALTKMLGREDFKASSGWLSRFKDRHGLARRRVCHECAGTNELEDEWKEETLPELVARYATRDIYNANETALFYRLTPDKVLAFKAQRCQRGWQSKERLTVMLCANMDGSDKLKPLVIGRRKNPRSFKHVKSLPVDYRANGKAWMASEEFVRWVKALDAKFTCQGRKVLLFVSDCSAHPHIANLQSIDLCFLPPSTSSQVPPMERGVIAAFRSLYRRRLLRVLLDRYETGGAAPAAVSVKDAIDMIHWAWQQVSASCIARCYEQAGFRKDPETARGADDAPGPSGDPDDVPDPIAQRTVQPTCGSDESPRERLDWDRLGRHVDIRSVTFEEFSAADEELACTAEGATSEVKVEDAEGDETEDDVEEGVVPRPPSTVEAARCVQRLKEFLSSRPESDDQHFHAASRLEKLVEKCRENGIVQKKITDYFKP